MRRRQFITLLGAAAAWPVAARAQQSAVPVVAFVNSGSPDGAAAGIAAFRKGLNESGFTEGQNVTVEYHLFEGHYDRLPSLMEDLIRRHVNVIVTPGTVPAALAAKAATKTIPIVFSVNEDPVKLGLVASLARPAGNVTGVNALAIEVSAKRLGLLHELAPTAARIAVLVNPAVASTTESTLHDAREAARALALDIQVLEAGSSREIELVFATLARERADALYIAANSFFNSRRVQIVTLANRHAIPTAYPNRQFVEVGGLMSYGPDFDETYRQIGAYTGRVLMGAKPAELPVVQSAKFEFVINLATARALGIEVPSGLLAIADEVIE
jgi:putative ABC transport system substrate-binding protein